MNARAFHCSLLILTCLLVGGSGCSSSSPPPQNQFPTPAAAAGSLVEALRANDVPRLKAILAPAADDILFSGDEVADRADRARFLSLYDAGHHIEAGADGVNTLIVGQSGWPFPVPIVKSGSGYAFDSETGKEEILNRRVGRNELSAEQVCLAIADAQREYVERRPMGGDLPEYARKLVSDPGTRNGLYWPTGEGERPSPLGPLVASAAAEGYGGPHGTKDANPPPPPYLGYRYKLLTAQGPHAKGGGLDYFVEGHLIGGFAVVAYPAQYGNSGVMTFIANHDGVVYQRDLGPDTERVAQGMTTFDPGAGWTESADAAAVGQGD